MTLLASLINVGAHDGDDATKAARCRGTDGEPPVGPVAPRRAAAGATSGGRGAQAGPQARLPRDEETPSLQEKQTLFRWSLCYILVPRYVFQVVSLLYTGTAVRGTQGWGCGHVGVVRVASDVPHHQDLRMASERFT